MSGSASHSWTMPSAPTLIEHPVEQAVGAQDLAPHDAGDDLGQHVGGEEQRAQHGAALDP